MVIIKDGEQIQDDWRHLDDETPIDNPHRVTLSLSRWLSLPPENRTSGAPWGVRLSPQDDVLSLESDLQLVGLIVLQMAPFTDGRSFTQARDLRTRLHYKGEIRVRGDFLRDQIFYLHRVGVNAFECPATPDLQGCLRALGEFSVTYQGTLDPNDALHRQRINRPSA